MNAAIIREFVCEYAGSGDVATSIVPLHGGLESCATARVQVYKPGGSVSPFVVKIIPHETPRELHVYRALDQLRSGVAAPKLLGWHDTGRDGLYMFLEWARASEPWPWKNPEATALVVEQLAHVHACDTRHFAEALQSWDYDRELLQSASATVELYRTAFLNGVRPGNRTMLKPLERVTTALPAIRRELAAFIGSTVLHGDAHTGNAIIRRSDDTHQAVLLDWGRARIGSPLEDICSWLQSVSFWEPEAKRVHDSLLKRYLRARGIGVELTPQFRDAYWLAAACNGLSGALRYHLLVMCDEQRSPDEQWRAARASADWLRVIRRADACVRN
jgi:aminoglycoside phosphotransferase (APT) family kinase protein